jgi:hypothetical protein
VSARCIGACVAANGELPLELLYFEEPSTRFFLYTLARNVGFSSIAMVTPFYSSGVGPVGLQGC